MVTNLPAALLGSDRQAIDPYGFSGAELISNEEILEHKTFFKGPTAGLMYEMLSPDGIHFWHWDALPGGTTLFKDEISGPVFHLVFVVKNQAPNNETNHAMPMAGIGNYEYNLFYLPPQTSRFEWLPQHKMEIFALNLQAGFFEKYMPGGHPVSKKLLGAFKKAKTLKAHEHNLPLTPHLMGILQDILNCPLEKQYKRMFLKAKVIELLSMMLSQMDEFKQLKHKAGLRQQDVSKMQDAREKLHQNLKSPCSLIDLAHQVGTNENYLKKHFKLLYGNTVYGYIRDLRMQQAKNMIKENKDLSEIAHAVGYKNVSHFTTAFKKYFGYSPYSIKG